MQFRNTTTLDSHRLLDLFVRHAEPWPHEKLKVWVRYSRGAEFSGTCYYADNQIYINLGKRNRYPYLIHTHIARAQSTRRYWWKELYTVEAASAYELALFVFLHEYFHWLIKRARRNTRQKESMCDRFATCALVDFHGAVVRDSQGTAVPREDWDFQDYVGFVAAALPKRARGKAARSVVKPPPDGQFVFDFLHAKK